MKKLLLYGVISLLAGGIIYLSWPKKKPCPCGAAATQNPDEAIDQMSQADLQDQILQLSPGTSVAGKTVPELKNLLKSIVSTK